MKEFRRIGTRRFGIIALVIVVSMAGLSMIGCPSSTSTSKEQTPQRPVADDYTISNLNQPTGDVVAVSIEPKTGKSPGARTIYYEGIDPTDYSKSTTVPQAEGTYTVTFDVAATSGWYAVTGLSAGTLTIINPDNPIPVAGDFNIGRLNQDEGSVIAVSITPKSGKSQGQITIYYNNSQTIPQEAGTYPVTFDVAAAKGYNAAYGLSAGTLTVNVNLPGNRTPSVSDYTYDNLNQTEGSVAAVIITPLSTASPGTRTIYYEGINLTNYSKKTALPGVAGLYEVTFNVDAADGWNSATGLRAGILSINQPDGNKTPSRDDYTLSDNKKTYTGNSVAAVTITKSGTAASPGNIVNIQYEGSLYPISSLPPTDAGDYVVTFGVTEAMGWNAATTLYAGILSVAKATPVIGDFVITGLTQFAGTSTVEAPTITPKAGKTTGSQTIYYESNADPVYPKTTALPTVKGKYTVTFDVGESKNWIEKKGFTAPEVLNLTNRRPSIDDYIITGLTQSFESGVEKPITVTAKSSGASSKTPVIKYNGSITPPSAIGNYRVTMSVEEDLDDGWEGTEEDIFVGILEINGNKTPVFGDYIINSATLIQTAGKVTGVTITLKVDGQQPPGLWTIWYEGKAGTSTKNYTKSTIPPQTAGEYFVTFDVAAAAGTPSWNAVTGLGSSGSGVTLVVLEGVKSDNITIGWSDALNTVTINPSATSANSNVPVPFSIVGTGFKSCEWYVNGVSVNHTDLSTPYSFKSSQPGKFTVSVLVSREEKVGETTTVKWYNAEAIVTVQ